MNNLITQDFQVVTQQVQKADLVSRRIFGLQNPPVENTNLMGSHMTPKILRCVGNPSTPASTSAFNSAFPRSANVLLVGRFPHDDASAGLDGFFHHSRFRGGEKDLHLVSRCRLRPKPEVGFQG